ncbi:MAG: DNA polymerase III subunit delta [Ferrimicrobium sp.]
MGDVVVAIVSDSVLAEERIVTEIDAGRAGGEEVRVLDGAGDSLGEILSLIAQRPLFASRIRIIVRNLDAIDREGILALATSLKEGVGDNRIVALQRTARIPKPLEGLVGSLITVEQVGVLKEADRRRYVESSVRTAGLDLEPAALQLLIAHLGSEVGGVGGIVRVLVAALPKDILITVDLLEPYLTRAGETPLWTLTDAIASGSISRTLDVLDRMLEDNARPAQLLLTVIERWFLELCAVTSSTVRTVDQAKGALVAAKLRAKPDFALRQMLTTTRHLDAARCGRAIRLIAEAQRSVRGDSALDSQLVLEILVARLSALFRR